jgi:hypothetical protein
MSALTPEEAAKLVWQSLQEHAEKQPEGEREAFVREAMGSLSATLAQSHPPTYDWTSLGVRSVENPDGSIELRYFSNHPERWHETYRCLPDD